MGQTSHRRRRANRHQPGLVPGEPIRLGMRTEILLPMAGDTRPAAPAAAEAAPATPPAEGAPHASGTPSPAAPAAAPTTGSGGPRVLSIEGLSQPAMPAPPEAAGGRESDDPSDARDGREGADAPDGPERRRGLRRPVFSEVGGASDVAPGEMRAVDADGTPVLIVNLGGEVYGFKNICPTDGRSPIDGGRLTFGVIVCPWHNCAYDARSGKRADGEPGAGLAVVPVAVRDGTLQVAVSAG